MRSTNRPQLRRTILIALVLSLPGSVASATPAKKSPHPVGTVARITDDVWQGNHRITKLTKLHSQDIIRTRGDGEAEVRIKLANTICTTADVDRIRIAPSPHVVLQLLQGELVCSMSSGNPQIPPVFRGTPAFSLSSTDPVFALTVRHSKTTVKVTRGYVVVSGRSGRSAAVVLGTQQQVAVAAGQDPQLPRPLILSHSEKQALKHLTASLPPVTDTTPPTVKIEQEPATAVMSEAASFSFAANEPRVIFACALDAQRFHPCTSTTSFSSLKPGTHSLAVTATDPAGNTSHPVIYAWLIDIRPPITTITSQLPSITSVTSPTFTFTADENTVKFECQLDTPAFTPCASPATYASLPSGKHTFSVRATDAAGNLGAPASLTWTIDTTVPKVTLLKYPPATTASASATFVFTTDKSPITFSCQLDNSAAASCSSPKAYTAIAEGKHLFSVQATDAAGNVGHTTYEWVVDRTPPSVKITSQPSNPTYSTSATFAFSASETPVTYTCKLDNGPAATCPNPQTYTGLSVATHTFSVTATDAAGNVSAAVTYTWAIYYLIG